MKQIVKPIKDTNILQQVQECLINDSKKCGRRNYTIFQTGKATLLRVSDVLRLRKEDVYNERGRVKCNAYIIDKKTKKRNVLYLKPIETDLEDYYDWLERCEQNEPDKRVFSSPWMFPPFTRPNKHIDEQGHV